MSTFVANRFNPDTDPNRPKIGATTEYKGITYRIEKVDYTTLAEVMKPTFIEPLHYGFDVVLFEPDKDRPAVYWIVWANDVHKQYNLTQLHLVKTCGECPFWMVEKTNAELGECWRPKRKRFGMRRVTDRKCRELKTLKPADYTSNIGITDYTEI